MNGRVAQLDRGSPIHAAEAPRVARLCPFEVGVVAWRAPEPTLTLVVKATFSLAEDGVAKIAVEQEPLSLDRPALHGAPDELDRASDFAPLKARVDVFLTGHARAASPMHLLPAGFAVDGLRKRFYAASEEPSAETPLLAAYLRSAADEPVRVGPSAVGSRDPALVSPDGVPIAELPRGFDYGAFNVAPADQQLTLLGASARLVLDGLFSGGERRTARLPGIRPRAFLLPRSIPSAGRPPDEIVLRCDTLWIDVDRALCTLTYRGVLATGTLTTAPSLVVALDAGDRKTTWARAHADLDDVDFLPVVRPEDLPSEIDEGPSTSRNDALPGIEEIDAEPEEGLDEEPSTSRNGGARVKPDIGPIPGADDDEATGIGRGLSSGRTMEFQVPGDLGEALPFRPPLLVLGGTRPSLASYHEEDVEAPAAADPRAALPFEGSSAKAPLPSRSAKAPATIPPPPASAPVLPFTAETPPLPFKPPLSPRDLSGLPFHARSPAAAPPASAPSLTAPSLSDTAQPFAVPPGLLGAPALPFVPSKRAAAEEAPFRFAKAPSRTVGESFAQTGDTSPVAAAPVEARLVKPRPKAPEARIPLAVYAEIKAEIWGDRGLLAGVLLRHEIDEAAWHENERHLAEALGKEASEGRTTLGSELREALRAARDRRPPDGERPLRALEEAYVTLLAALDRAEDPSAFIAARGLSPAEWRRLRRRFLDRASHDAKAGEALSARLAAARRSAGGGGGMHLRRVWKEPAPPGVKRVPARPKR